MKSVKGLQRILRKRLPFIDRWGGVSVYRWDSDGLPGIIKPVEGMFYVVWTKPKRKNVHPYEIKEIPLGDLPLIIERNRTRLRNLTKSYK